jgi:hypothetical protein
MVSNGKGPSTFDGPKPDSLAQRPALRASGPASRSIHQFGLEDHQLSRSGLIESGDMAHSFPRRIAGERTDTKFTLVDDDKPLSYVEGFCQDSRAYACVLENTGIVLFQLAVSPALKEVGGQDIGHATSC